MCGSSQGQGLLHNRMHRRRLPKWSRGGRGGRARGDQKGERAQAKVWNGTGRQSHASPKPRPATAWGLTNTTHLLRQLRLAACAKRVEVSCIACGRLRHAAPVQRNVFLDGGGHLGGQRLFQPFPELLAPAAILAPQHLCTRKAGKREGGWLGGSVRHCPERGKAAAAGSEHTVGAITQWARSHSGLYLCNVYILAVPLFCLLRKRFLQPGQLQPQARGGHEMTHGQRDQSAGNRRSVPLRAPTILWRSSSMVCSIEMESRIASSAPPRGQHRQKGMGAA